MICKVIPVRKLPRDKLYVFDYKIPKSLETIIRIGSIIKIDFRKEKILGVVIKLQDKSKRKNLKSINSISNLVLPKSYINFILKFSKNFLVSPSSVFYSVIPKIPKRLLKDKIYKFDEKFLEKRYLNYKVSNLFKKIDIGRDLILISNSDKIIFYFYKELIQKFIKFKSQVLFLFPYLDRLKFFLSFLPKEYKNYIGYCDYSLKTSINLEYDFIKKILDKKISIILGLRSSIFLPIPDLKYIIVDSPASSQFYQQEQNPRYSLNSAIFLLKDIIGSKLIFSGYPNCFIFPNIKYKSAILTSKKINLKVIDLNLERKKRNFTPISDYLEEKIYHSIKLGKKILLIINRLFEYQVVLCRDCGEIFKCKFCNRNLKLIESRLFCNNCRKYCKFTLTCNYCKSRNLQFIGFGKRAVEKFLKQKGLLKKNYVIVTSKTETLDYELENSEIQYAAIINFEDILYPIRFDSLERGFLILKHIEKVLNFKGCGEEIIVQTYTPNLSIFNYFNSPWKFYQKFLFERKNLKLPPFGTILNIEVKSKYKNKIKREISDKYFKLLKIAKNEGFEVLKPCLEELILEKGWFKGRIVLRLFREEIPDMLYKFLSKLPQSWVIYRF